MSESVKQPQGIQSLETGVQVLDALRRAPRPLALREVAQAAGLSSSQAHRYLTSWIRTGYVRQDTETGAYRLGDEALALGMAMLRRYDPIERTLRLLPEMAERTGETAVMTVWTGHGPICIRWIRGRALIGIDAGIGTVYPVLGSAAGRAFAAWLPETLVLPLALDEAARDPGVDVVAWLAENRRTTRERGYATARSHFLSGISALACPVFDLQHQIVATIGLIVRESDLATLESGYAELLREVAGRDDHLRA